MSFPRIFAITGRIISQFRHDHRTLALIFVVPIVVMSLLGYVFRAQENSVVSVGIVNEDRPAQGTTSMAPAVIASIKANDKLSVREMSRADADQAVKDGTVRVALVFPANFTQDLLTKRSTSVETIVEGSNPSQASGALAAVGQSVLAAGPIVLKSLVPPQAAGLVPSGPPINLKVARLYGSEDLKMLDFFCAYVHRLYWLLPHLLADERVVSA